MAVQPEEQFRNFLLRRSSYLYELENQAIQNMLTPYQQALPAMKRQLEFLQSDAAGGFTKEFRISRMRNQVAEVEFLLQIAGQQSAEELRAVLQDLAMLDSDVYAQMLNSQFGKIGVDISSIPFRQVDQILNSSLRGYEVGDPAFWNKMNSDVTNRIRGELAQSIIQGEDMARATNRIINLSKQGGFGTYSTSVLANWASMIARSEIQYVSNQVARQTYNENQDVLKGMQHSSALDRRTCQQCISLDSKVYLFKDGVNDAPLLPIHVQCRCVYIPITKSWKELGVKVPESKKGEAKAFIGKPLNGLTYNQWLNTQPVNVQKEVLGSSRYKLWKSGKIELKQMTGKKGVLRNVYPSENERVPSLQSLTKDLIESMG